MKGTKKTVTCLIQSGGKITNRVTETRHVRADTQGEFITRGKDKTKIYLKNDTYTIAI